MTWRGDYDGFAGDMEPDVSYGSWNRTDQSYAVDYEAAERARLLYTFYSEEDLVTSAIFQKHLSMALAHKDKNIRELQNEILNYMETK